MQDGRKTVSKHGCFNQLISRPDRNHLYVTLPAEQGTVSSCNVVVNQQEETSNRGYTPWVPWGVSNLDWTPDLEKHAWEYRQKKKKIFQRLCGFAFFLSIFFFSSLEMKPKKINTWKKTWHLITSMRAGIVRWGGGRGRAEWKAWFVTLNVVTNFYLTYFFKCNLLCLDSYTIS